MNNKYKLCRLETYAKTKVQPIDIGGEPYGDTLLTYEDDSDYTYAIYENLMEQDDEDWDEYEYFGDDLRKAEEKYNELTKGNK